MHLRDTRASGAAACALYTLIVGGLGASCVACAALVSGVIFAVTAPTCPLPREREKETRSRAVLALSGGVRVLLLVVLLVLVGLF